MYVTSPIPAPCTVTDADPVVARFTLFAADAVGTLYDSKALDVAGTPFTPTVTIAFVLVLCPAGILHTTAVSETHTLDSHEVKPIFAFPLSP